MLKTRRYKIHTLYGSQDRKITNIKLHNVKMINLSKMHFSYKNAYASNGRDCNSESQNEKRKR